MDSDLGENERPLRCEDSSSPDIVPTKSASNESENCQSRGPQPHIFDAHGLLKELRQTGRSLRSDKDQPRVTIKPSWFNNDLFLQAGRVYERHFMGINFAHLSGLLLLVRVDTIYKTLGATGESDSVSKLFKRYFNTVKHVKTWYEGNILEENSDAHRSLLIVRGMHNKVCSKLNTSCISQSSTKLEDTTQAVPTSETLDIGCSQVHISEYDIMITQFAFIGFIVTKPKFMGLLDDFSATDLESLLHFWRLIGYYLGASDKYNLCSYSLPEIVSLCEAITELEYKSSLLSSKLHEPPGIMSLNIVRSVKFIPMLTIYGMMRYLYELLEVDYSEVEHKLNWYSSLSYTLMKLVMTRLLAYRPLRCFNNGLTRLSVFLVGKVESWFANRLERRYGSQLRL